MVCKLFVPGQYPVNMGLDQGSSACVLARKASWIKNACLAAALIFPAVAAVHGILLAALHRDGAVDMDVYGAFQFCSIGILVGPVTVRLSKTYFNDPGRNTIFVWAGLILAGLLSLTIEFYRISPFHCKQDGSGNPISSDPSKFPYGDETNCTMLCSVEQGPFSPMRNGSANNIYVIPAPHKLTFGAATLLAAACCVHAILWLVSMMDKILEINWKSRFGASDNDSQIDEPISGTNGATKGNMRNVNNTIRFFLSVAVIPVFGGAAFAILVIGERNFFSRPVRYQNEPMASIGQWAPIVGTGMACLGSLYLLLATDIEILKEKSDINGVHHCKCSHHPELPGSVSPRTVHGSPSSRTSHSMDYCIEETPVMIGTPIMRPVTSGLSNVSSHELDREPTVRPSLSTDFPSDAQRHISSHDGLSKRPVSADNGSRRKVAEVMIAAGNFLGTAAHDWFDLSEFRRGLAVNYPEIPGEGFRNENFWRIKKQYDPQRDADGNASPMPRSHSRTRSFVGSISSGQDIEGGGPLARTASPRPRRASSRSPSPYPPLSRQRANTVPMKSSYDLHQVESVSSTGQIRGRQRARRDTLEVPRPVYHHNAFHIHHSSPPPPSTPSPG
ncbi:hypothetical protein PT974_02136 [Cladobotryum mycophilum]|uniref:Uncharacterized protein n=1 Tax=Cladobotryum mycophilum TaxID=491253 RepID=A0ABR0SX98_9HYPO